MESGKWKVKSEKWKYRQLGGPSLTLMNPRIVQYRSTGVTVEGLYNSFPPQKWTRPMKATGSSVRNWLVGISLILTLLVREQRHK